MDIVINLTKPRDISSQQTVTKVKKFFGAKKAGHAGTLDPIATGVLIICLNEATKISRFLLDLDKEYIVKMKLGEKTDTGDLTGKVLEKRSSVALKEKDIYGVLKNFVGQIKQIPPMYSAIKIKGQPLYKLARMGIEISRPERVINIYQIDLIHFNQPYLELKILCSKGTYVRTLCEDIGEALNVGAHMISLNRTKIGCFEIEDSVSLDKLRCENNAIYSIDSALLHLSEIILNEESYHKAKNGMPVIMITANFPIKQKYVRLKDPGGKLFAIGKLEQNRITVERLLN
jgi:tRNA pseudouridine55 synthase